MTAPWKRWLVALCCSAIVFFIVAAIGWYDKKVEWGLAWWLALLMLPMFHMMAYELCDIVSTESLDADQTFEALYASPCENLATIYIYQIRRARDSAKLVCIDDEPKYLLRDSRCIRHQCTTGRYRIKVKGVSFMKWLCQPAEIEIDLKTGEQYALRVDSSTGAWRMIYLFTPIGFQEAKEDMRCNHCEVLLVNE